MSAAAPGLTLVKARDLIDQARAVGSAYGASLLDELLQAQGLETTLGIGEVTGIPVVNSTEGLCEYRQVVLPGGLTAVSALAASGERLVLLADPWAAGAMPSDERCLLEPAAATSAVLAKAVEALAGVTHQRGHVPRHARVSGDNVVDFVDHAIERALQLGASDIHFECDRDGLGVKFRLDGVMRVGDRLAGTHRAEEAISRIKVMAHLDITERRLPQDGRFRFERQAGSPPLDLRVSIMPSIHGEDAVLRILDKGHLRNRGGQIDLSGLGFDAVNAKAIRGLASRPNGMLLITGPTGSGKTTTVYAALSEINSGEEKIVTIEDPVEYELPGVLQIPVNEKKGLTFARGLRSILRHDPDRILVGEIRDAETAEIAVQSSLTGHLVFTTVHANSLFDVIGRFRHFGLDMFGFLSSLNGVVVQRLLRALCRHCAAWRSVSSEEQEILALMGASQLVRVPNVGGCQHCSGTGYRGRFVAGEVHRLDDEFKDLVLRGADVTQLKRKAFTRGTVPLLAHALAEVASGRTSLEEVIRVVGPA